MRNILWGVLLISGLLGGCASVTSSQGTFRYEKFEPKSLFEVRKLSFRIEDATWYRAPNLEYNHMRFLKAVSPSTKVEVLSQWSLGPETTLKRRYVDLMPREQAEYWISLKTAQLAAQGGIVTDSGVELQDWAGRPGFRITATYTTGQGLDMQYVGYGASYDRHLYLMSYESDTVEHFKKTLSSFEAMAKSARIDQSN